MATTTNPLFPIVGIGTSAGGLEALEEFFAPIAADCGHAFVIVQHLDPTHATRLGPLLQRVTKMPVSEITDGLVVERNHIYVIPPNSRIARRPSVPSAPIPERITPRLYSRRS